MKEIAKLKVENERLKKEIETLQEIVGTYQSHLESVVERGLIERMEQKRRVAGTTPQNDC